MTKTAEPQQEFTWGKLPTRSEVQDIELHRIHVPAEYEREDSAREDEALTNSIRKHGVQQPVHVIPEGDDFTLVKGTRRLSISYVCRYPTIPAIVEPPAPPDTDPVAYRNRLRFHLTIRQDLLPSQRADFIVQTMAKFQMTQKQIAQYLGYDAGSISGWLAIRDYHPSIVKLIDAGEITMFAARSFDGVKPAKQLEIYRALKNEFKNMPGGELHRLVRERFSPLANPEFYVNPKQTLKKLKIQKKGRKSKKRPKLTKSEKDILSNDLNLKEAELRDLKSEIRDLKKINILAGPVVHAILRNEEITSELSQDMLMELHRFSEMYA